MQGIKDQSDILLMFFQSLRPDNNVVQVDMTDLPNKMTKSRRHAALVDHGGVTNTHRYNSPFVKAPGSMSGEPPDVIRVNLSLEEQVSHVELAKDLTLRAVTKDLLYAG